MSDFVSEVNFELRRVSVRTFHGESVAKKMARLKMMDMNHFSDLRIWGIYQTDDGEWWYTYQW